MIRLSDSAKKVYANFIDADGKFIIDESLPDDLKKTFSYFNDHGINVLTDSLEDHYPDISDEKDDDEEMEDNDFDEDLFDDDIEIDNGDAFISEGIETSEKKNENLNDLNNLF